MEPKIIRQLAEAARETVALLLAYPEGSRLSGAEPVLWQMMQRHGEALKEAVDAYGRASGAYRILKIEDKDEEKE